MAVEPAPVAFTVTCTGPAYPARAVTVKLSDAAPDGTVAEAGAESLALLVVMASGCPLTGAMATSVTVQVLLLPAVSAVGVQESD